MEKKVLFDCNICFSQYDMAISLQEIDDTIERQSKEGEKAKIEIQHDYARVDVYFQTLNVKKIEQSPVISVCMCIFLWFETFYN